MEFASNEYNLETDESFLDNVTAPLSINDHIVSSYSPYIKKPDTYKKDFQNTPNRIRKFSFSLQDVSMNQDTNQINIHSQKSTTNAISCRSSSHLNLRSSKNTVGKIKKYDQVKSKVRIYIDDIKEKKKRRLPNDVSPNRHVNDISEESNSNVEINWLKDKLKVTNEFISELQDEKYDLQIKVMELKTNLKDTRFELSNAKSKIKYDNKINSMVSKETQTDSSELQSPTLPLLMTPSYNKHRNFRRGSKISMLMNQQINRRYSTLSSTDSSPLGTGTSNEGSTLLLNQEDLEYNTVEVKKQRKHSSDSVKSIFIKLFANCGRNKDNSICPCQKKIIYNNFQLTSRSSPSPDQDEGYGQSLSSNNPNDLHKIVSYAKDIEEDCKAIRNIILKNDVEVIQ